MQNLTDVSDVLPATGLLSNERGLHTAPVRASKTSVNFYNTTWRVIPDDSHLRLHPYFPIKLEGPSYAPPRQEAA